MDGISISVIMPSLNVKDYIEKAVRSVMNQTLKNIEILCIDAGSTDGTLEIINMLMQEDNRIRIINSPKKSYGYQLNIAFNMARGEYIAVVETDDYVSNNMYEELYCFGKKYSADIVKGNYYAFWTQSNGEKVFLTRENLFQKDLYDKVIIPKEESYVATSDWYLWTGIYKKELIKNNNILLSETPGAAFQDIGFLHRSNVASNKSYYINKSYYYYCLDREDSSSNSGRGIEYSYYEYSRLLEESWDESEEVLLYGRMAGFFEGCINGIGEKDLNDKDTCERFQWFVEKLTNAINRGIINENNVYRTTWNHIFPLPSSIDEVYQKKLKREIGLKKKLGCKENVKIVIFGCGNFGYYAYKWLKENEYTIFAYSDNNHELWGKRINGIPIISPENLDANNENLRFLIANEKHYDDIEKQLIGLKISKKNIAIFCED